MLLIVLASVVGCAFSQAPVWYPNGTCGTSKYADAGDLTLPGVRVSGGIESRQYEFPWLCNLRDADGDPNSYFCGCSVLNEQWVLTSARCVSGLSSVAVATGSHSLYAPSNAEVIQVGQTIFVHENYGLSQNANEFDYDVALIKLPNPIAISENVRPVCAPDVAVDYTYQQSQVAGWGTASDGLPVFRDYPRFTTMNITTNALCQSLAGTEVITGNMICAGDNNGFVTRGACSLDQGTPLTVNQGGSFIAVGIYSYVNCQAGRPQVYTSVAAMSDWITAKMDKN